MTALLVAPVDSLLDLRASRSAWTVASVVALLSIVLFMALAAFVQVPLLRLPAFMPAYESALTIVELLSAQLLLAQYLRTRSKRLLVLACGYFFNACIVPLHALSFPGSFAPDGIIGGGQQTTAWLYSFWHAGFPLFALAYALLHDTHPAHTAHAARPKQLAAFAAAAVMLLVVVIGVVSTAGHAWLPVVIDNGNYRRLVTLGISPSMVLFCILTLIALSQRRQRSVLDLWVGVVMVVWALDISMSAVLGSSRYDLGWYAGRIFGLCAGTVVLCALLWEASKMYQRLIDAVALAAQREQDLLKSRDELARAQRLEALGQLTGGIAHDFNNVLQVLSASLQLMRYRFADNIEAQNLIDRSLTSVDRGARLASELLAFARRQPLRPKVINVSLLLSGMAEVLERTLGNAIQVQTIIPPQLWNTVADPAMLENALLNLALNARDAMPDGGTVTLSVGNVDAATYDFSGALDVPPMDYVLIAVSDTETGIAEDILPHVFEPFFTTKPISDGTGLGLSMVHGFAKQSAGHITIESVLARGTSISIYLPRSNQESYRPPKKTQHAMVGGSESILVVEDNPDVRIVAVHTLELLGYRVRAAHDAGSALALVDTGMHFDLLFSDVIMPGPINTRTMAQRVKTALPGIVILFTSGYIENALGKNGSIDPDEHLLSKPYDALTLATMVRDLLDEQPS